MYKRLVTVFAFALVVAAVASLLLYRLVSAKMSSHSAQAQKKLVAAVRTLETGTLIRTEDVKLLDWSGSFPTGAIETVDAAIGRGVISPIYDSEPLVENRLAPRGAGGGLAATIPTGMRAVAVRVNDLVGVSGFVLPGMRVDVIISGNPPGNTAANTGTMSKTILQDIQVLSAGPKFQRDEEGKPVSVPVVNLLVTPEQAETLSLASNEMRIQLVLRNPLDKGVAQTQGMAIATLFTGRSDLSGVPKRVEYRPERLSKPAPAITAATFVHPDPILVEVINGAKRTELKFAQAEKADR
ncbi:MAG: Flp pilus assembly protein CpaB [Bryobacteraceae bacterium]